MMLRKAMFLGMVLAAAGLGGGACTETGKLKMPFTRDEPFVPTAVPADFAVVVDENHDTHFARQHIKQIVNAADATSRTEYTTFRDYNNTVSNKFSQETPLSPVQLQNMWNEVKRYDLLNRSTIWVNWLSNADLYKRDSYTVQIRANGQTRSYRATNGFPGPVRPLMVQISAVRLPISQDSKTPVIGGPRVEPATEPTSRPVETAPTMPATTTAPSAELPMSPFGGGMVPAADLSNGNQRK